MAKLARISPARLRTWQRRYGIPDPERTAAGHRRYTADDVSVVRQMVALVEQGVPASEAARALRSGARGPGPLPSVVGNPPQLAAPLLDAVAALDAKASISLIRAAVDRFGWSGALETVIFPALAAAGDRWHGGLFTPAHEHLLSNAIRQELLLGMAGHPPPPAASPLVLLACPESEDHDLGILALRLFLERAGLRVLYLGAALPSSALARAVVETRPAAVCLSATATSGCAALADAEQALAALHSSSLL
ncbi:MAG: MerR family transcriptional regulator, partial [Dehalococcoidia bacterium]